MKFSSKRSVPPESFLYTGEANHKTTIRHLQYSLKEFNEFNEKVEIKDDAVDWIIVEGLNDVNAITSFCQNLNVDNLTIEDILNVNQRNKTKKTSQKLVGASSVLLNTSFILIEV